MSEFKVLITPGAFKHSLKASQVAEAIAEGLRRSGLKADLRLMPIADGGNGTLDAFLMNGGQRKTITVKNPLGAAIEAEYGVLDDGNTAVIEMALASGIELVMERDPIHASTYGTGQLMQAALDDGAKQFIVGMGGSATVDGGMGCLQALGVRFLDGEGQEIKGLGVVQKIDVSALDPRWREVDVIIASDVDNPALGENGAAAVFGPQKGATPAQIDQLEHRLRHLFMTVHDQLGVDVTDVRGGGAAGAFAAGLMAFLGGRIESGIDLILKHNNFEQELIGATLVITGEGQIDDQTLHGKGPLGVAQLAHKHSIPTVAIVGSLNTDDETLHNAGLQAVLPIIPHPMSLDDALANAADLVRQTALRLGYLLQLG